MLQVLLQDKNVINGILGACGGLIGLIVREKGCIYLPRIKDHKLYLNSLSGILLGLVAGILGNHTAVNALMWGIGGSTIISGVVEAIDRKTPLGTGVFCSGETKPQKEK